MMLLNDDLNSIAKSIVTVVTAAAATGDRQRASMMLLACLVSLVGDDKQGKAIMASMLVETAIEMDGDIATRLKH